MKVICKKNTAKDFDLKEVTTVISNDVRYSLEIGKEYLVMGIMIDKTSNCAYYLVDDFVSPFCMPYLLFDISDHTLPKNWYVNVYDKNSPGDLFYLSGFYELCMDEDFHDLLMDRDEAAMILYFQRKIELENE